MRKGAAFFLLQLMHLLCVSDANVFRSYGIAFIVLGIFSFRSHYCVAPSDFTGAKICVFMSTLATVMFRGEDFTDISSGMCGTVDIHKDIMDGL